VSEPLVSIEQARKAYGEGAARQLVLDELSLTLEAGEFAVVLGPSGCGKTTLLNLIGGLDRPDAGRVRSCGLDLTRATRGELTAYRALSVGFVFQFYNLLPTLTAQENVEAGIRVAGVEREPAREAARSLLARVGLGSLGDRFPSQLSGGEQQRVAIARALAKRPPLLLADEPTGNLDEETAAGVLGLMRELNEETGATFVVVSHNPLLARDGTRTIRLSRGRLADPSPA
jgi:putative ABC transport system ATP-binding protein